jgi:hypothetical protein
VREVSLIPAGNPLRQLGRQSRTHLTGGTLAPLGSLPPRRLASLRLHSGDVGGSGVYFTSELGDPLAAHPPLLPELAAEAAPLRVVAHHSLNSS